MLYSAESGVRSEDAGVRPVDAALQPDGRSQRADVEVAAPALERLLGEEAFERGALTSEWNFGSSALRVALAR